ncbi:XRE family transcriptional regulator [Comamonas thiooxydans]|nr:MULTISPECIES: XRE family transcriptional regulator [Comamonas]QOQ84338.1 XRE family transcriptional regulator [Comamonas thiooxydans]
MNMRMTHGAGTIERALRQSLSQPGSAVAEAAGWDSSNVSRVLSGQQGVPIAKLDSVVSAAGYVMVSREYLDAIGVLSRVGAYCHCARAGGGECGPDNRARCGQGE